MLGRPRLGETTRIQIRVKESKEFKVTFYLVIIIVQCLLFVFWSRLTS